MIGVFDSGMGGLVTLGYLKQFLPNNDFMYLGDTKHVPYGEKDPLFIQERTFSCLQWMFSQGCGLVILACNTASAHAIRKRQSAYPEKKVLSITIPGVEELVQQGYKHPLLLATRSTIQSDIYQNVLHGSTGYSTTSFESVIGTGLVQCIESGASEAEILLTINKLQLHTYTADCLILGCTHYPLLTTYLKLFTGPIPYIDSGYEAAKKLPSYLVHHPELGIDTNKKTSPIVTYYITGDVGYGYEENIVSIP